MLRILMVVLASVIATGLTVSAAPAAQPKSVTISLNRTGDYYVQSTKTSERRAFTAVLSRARKGGIVKLQAFAPVYGKTKATATTPTVSAWQTIRTVKVGRSGSRVKVNLGTHAIKRGYTQFRAVAVANKSYRVAISRVMAAHVLQPCATTAAPAAVRSTFSNPLAQPDALRHKRSVVLADSWRQYICAAAPGSTLKIAMWMVHDDGVYRSAPNVSARVLQAIDWVERYRGVKVSMVLDQRNESRLLVQTRRWLRSMSGGALQSTGSVTNGALTVCVQGCLSASASGTGSAQFGDMHDKFVAISDTVWSKGVDPAVATGSSNWSFWQLRDYWNSFTGLRDPQAYARFDARFGLLRDFSRGVGQASTTYPAGTSIDGVRRSTTDRSYFWASRARTDDQVSPVGVTFSPQMVGTDNILDRLAKVSCTPEHRTIRVAMYYASTGVGESVARRLVELKAAGCEVEYVMSRKVSNPGEVALRTSRPVFDTLVAGGITPKCLPMMHAKDVVLDTLYDGVPTMTVFTGSRNLDSSGLKYSDEISLRLDGATVHRAFSDSLTRMVTPKSGDPNSVRTCSYARDLG